MVAAGDERYLLCAAGAAGVVSCAIWFLLCVLQRVIVPVCVVLCVSWICGRGSHWNGCMIVVIWCCHVRRYMRVSHVMLQNALWWLHERCMGLVLGRKPEHETVFFRVKWMQPSMKGTSCVQRVRLRVVCLFVLPHCSGGFKLLWVCLCVHSCSVFWNLWLQIAVEWLHDCCDVLLPCVSRHAGLPRDAGKRIVMAASRFLAAAALCVIFLSFAAESCES